MDPSRVRSRRLAPVVLRFWWSAALRAAVEGVYRSGGTVASALTLAHRDRAITIHVPRGIGAMEREICTNEVVARYGSCRPSEVAEGRAEVFDGKPYRRPGVSADVVAIGQQVSVALDRIVRAGPRRSQLASEGDDLCPGDLGHDLGPRKEGPTFYTGPDRLAVR